MSLGKPKLPPPASMATPARQPTSMAGGGTQGAATAASLQAFSFAPRLASFTSRAGGRRSLIGG